MVMKILSGQVNLQPLTLTHDFDLQLRNTIVLHDIPPYRNKHVYKFRLNPSNGCEDIVRTNSEWTNKFVGGIITLIKVLLST